MKEISFLQDNVFLNACNAGMLAHDAFFFLLVNSNRI